MIFLTEYNFGGHIMCGQVEADSWAAAEKFVEENGYGGEKVIGILIEEVPDQGTAKRLQKKAEFWC